MHSHDYRSPKPFSGKTVAVLGASASGIDIGLEVSTTAERVFLCHNRDRMQAPLPPNMKQRAGITGCTTEGDLLLADGSQLPDVDVLLYCTGYHFSYPFLSESCQVEVVGRQVRTLFKHLINAAHPTMALVGVPLQILPFPLFDVQVKKLCYKESIYSSFKFRQFSEHLLFRSVGSSAL